ncbi:hypothetical protein OK074_7256 [Actinobacteria bacterium OK074]|nr:hypothetical protein OK074_7256 [Actinobacteria bacterium OK074]
MPDTPMTVPMTAPANPSSTAFADISVRRATPADRPLLERLWLMFRHDLSEFGGALPRPDGTFRDERLHSALADPGWAAYLLMGGQHPIGLAFVRGLDGPTRVMNSFFVVRGARRRGLGLRLVREVTAGHPGTWEVPFQDDNRAGAPFWRRVAEQLAGDAWTEEHRPVPDRPDLRPDAWISFGVRGSADAEERRPGR